MRLRRMFSERVNAEHSTPDRGEMFIARKIPKNYFLLSVRSEMLYVDPWRSIGITWHF